MTPKHTPAPWDYVTDKIVGTVIISEGLIIAKMRTLEGVDHEANAKIIAAAPELLEALIEVVRISDRKHDAWDKAKAAIKKATE